MTNQLSTATRVLPLLKQIEELMKLLIAGLAAQDGGNVAMKKADGRMTDAGIDALYADFAADQMTDDEIAKKYDISSSGVTKRKAKWKKGRR